MTRTGRRRTQRCTAAVAGLLTAVLAGCGADGGGAASPEAAPRELTVLAASSLTEVFTELGAQFESDHPGTTVTFAFDSSATLATQAAEGAPADVLATADQRTMDDAVAADAVAGQPTVFAVNRLVLVTPADNPASITGVQDLADDEVSYVVCVPTAPCGDLAAQALAAADVMADPVSLEVDVKAVLAKVTEDEADAGIVYATDAVAAGEAVQSFELTDGQAPEGAPGARGAVTDYPVAVLAQAQAAELAADWISLLQSAPGQRALREAGFSIP